MKKMKLYIKITTTSIFPLASNGDCYHNPQSQKSTVFKNKYFLKKTFHHYLTFNSKFTSCETLPMFRSMSMFFEKVPHHDSSDSHILTMHYLMLRIKTIN